MNSPELRERCAEKLLAASQHAKTLTAFLGLDGFVDEIIHVVDKRDSSERFDRIPTIEQFAQRIAGAAGKSTNIELVPQQVKLGGNGPIMANALAALDLRVTYLGALGYPDIHPVFGDFAKHVEAHSMSEASHTDALEFEDGKLMLGKMDPLKELTWANIQSRFGRENFTKNFGTASLIGFLNWTMIPYMSDVWEALQTEICPGMSSPRRRMFLDLADPEKRTREDIDRALKLIGRFQEFFDVIVGLNEKETMEICRVLRIKRRDSSKEALADVGRKIQHRLPVDTVVIHPVTYALAVSEDSTAFVDGPFIRKPVITTGAGDHFNAGFCLGKLLGLDNAMSVLTGVTASGYYVRTAKSPSISQLADMMRNWPEQGA